MFRTTTIRRDVGRVTARLGVALVLLFATIGATGQVGAQDTAPEPGTGTVYALTNSPTNNEVLAFARAEDGTLKMAGRFPTNGQGSGVAEGSTGAVIVASVEGQSSPVDLGGGADFVIAANAASDSISVFAIDGMHGLELVEQQMSGGERPTSLTVRNGLLYVLNSAGDVAGAGACLGGHPSITGFTLAGSGQLEPIPDSTRMLSGGPLSGCAQVSFNPKGNVLIVSQIAADTITTFPVGSDGVPGDPIDNPTTGSGPFGFTFDQTGNLLVTENAQAMTEGGTVASYAINDDGSLSPIGGSVMIGETDPCWIVVTPDGRYAYATNFGPMPLLNVEDGLRRGTVSSFTVGSDGSLTVLDARAAEIGVGAFDMALGGGGRYLYALNTVAGTISGFAIGDDGSLTLVTATGGLPTNDAGSIPVTFGLAARDAA
jgi:6-phosphogluconolactonase